MRHPVRNLAFAAIAAMGLSFSAFATAADEEAVRALLKQNDCFKCHAIDKTKKGPSYKKIAAKHKEKGSLVEAEQKMIKHMTTSPKVKLEDGTEEEHKIIDTKDPAELKRIAQWILSM